MARSRQTAKKSTAGASRRREFKLPVSIRIETTKDGIGDEVVTIPDKITKTARTGGQGMRKSIKKSNENKKI